MEGLGAAEAQPGLCPAAARLVQICITIDGNAKAVVVAYNAFRSQASKATYEPIEKVAADVLKVLNQALHIDYGSMKLRTDNAAAAFSASWTGVVDSANRVEFQGSGLTPSVAVNLVTKLARDAGVSVTGADGAAPGNALQQLMRRRTTRADVDEAKAVVKLLKGLDPENEDHYHKILECEGRLLALLPTGMAEQVKVATEAVKTARLSSTAVDQLTEPLRQQMGAAHVSIMAGKAQARQQQEEQKAAKELRMEQQRQQALAEPAAADPADANNNDDFIDVSAGRKKRGPARP